jgi:Domain of unknown function (DUF4477)
MPPLAAPSVYAAMLLVLQASFQQPELWREAALLDRLLYKNRSQHRSSCHFQRLQEVREGWCMQAKRP